MRTISQYDAQLYRDELEGLREEMTSILVEMERRHSTASREAFSVIEEQEHPKMRAGEPGGLPKNRGMQ